MHTPFTVLDRVLSEDCHGKEVQNSKQKREERRHTRNIYPIDSLAERNVFSTTPSSDMIPKCCSLLIAWIDIPGVYQSWCAGVVQKAVALPKVVYRVTENDVTEARHTQNCDLAA